MSKYSKSGKRSHSGAGNHFDKLLKVCSNSKVAGSIGRFGVASFTSIRSTVSNDVSEEPEKKPKSKYSSFKKRARLDPAVKKTEPTPSSVYSSLGSQGGSSGLGGNVGVSAASTVYKPRKFFKSRGPMEVDAGAAGNHQVKPVRPDVGSLMPMLPPQPVIPSSPLIPSNTNTNSQYYGEQIQGQHSHKKHKKHGNSKKLENLSSPPPPPTSGSSDANFTSPPIKLRIFKDRGKFVAEAPPTPIQPIVPESSSPVKKRGRKPGSKNKKAGEEPNVEAVEQKPPKQTKRSKAASATVAPPSAPSRAASGRTTRNSSRRLENTGEESDSGMPSLDRELRNSYDGSFPADGSTDLYQPPPAPQLMVGTCEIQQQSSHISNIQPTQEIIKKLEEDADFKKLSEMLSSMENDNVHGSADQFSSSQDSPVSQQQDFNNIQSYQQNQQGGLDTYPVNLSSSGNNGAPPQGLSAFAAQAYMQQQFRQQMQQQQQQQQQQEQNLILQQQHLEQQQQAQNFYNNPMEIGYHTQDQQHSSAIQLPQQQTLPKANDIRSILVNDWTDFDDETHSPTGHRSSSRPSSQASHHSQSPPKFSRFDMSAFMPSGGGGKDIQQQQQQQSPQFPPQDTTDQIDHHFGTDSQQQLPFNIHSSPYAMRNLLNVPPGQDPQFPQSQQDLNQQQLASSTMHFPSCALESLQQHHHHSAPLNSLSTCAKQEAISVLDSVLKQQQMTNDNQGSPSLPIPQLPLTTQKTQIAAPSTKKASIFKSRARDQNQNGEGTAGTGTGNDGGTTKGGSKRLALYRHKFGGQEDVSMEDHNRPQYSQSAAQVFSEFDDEMEDESVRLRNVRIKNVKAVHQLQESGEFHEFDGDVQYILEDLQSKNPMNIRCLSAVTLATRCMEPSFRMHLRAHGTVAEFCRELHDCPQHPELALLAALVLFVLSQDRLNMDLDTDTLKLILALSKADDCNDPESQSVQDTETLRHKQRVLALCVEMKNRGHATHLKLDRITASELALETLLHLTSKRAGEWVKHELRSLGGLDSIVNEIDSSLRLAQMELGELGWSEGALERLRKVDRCLQVLQQVTFNHEHNQRYLLGHSDREIETQEGGMVRQKCVEASPKIFVELFRFCKDNLLHLQMQMEPAAVMREILFSVLRVLVNLSHDYRGIVLGSEILLAMDGFLQLCLHSTFEMGHYFPDEKIFDLLMHSLCMLLNLVEHSRSCRNAILTSTVQKSSAGNYRVPDSSYVAADDAGVHEQISVLDAFVEMFLCRERAAKKEEQHTDNILTKGPEDAKSSSQKGENGGSQDKNSQDSEGSSLQDTIDKLIQTAGKHMENSLIAAYISLLLAYLIMDDPVAATQVRQSMPDGKYLPLMTFLKKLFNFMSITSSASGSIRGLKATAIALRFFAKADPASDEELKKLIPD